MTSSFVKVYNLIPWQLPDYITPFSDEISTESSNCNLARGIYIMQLPNSLNRNVKDVPMRP
jgi:hypothetical protein